MRICLQRVTEASVTVGQELVGRIGPGLLALIGVGRQDERSDVDYLVDKVLGLRIFDDDDGKMNRSLLDVGGQLLAVSQFTLWGDCRKGRRPGFSDAAPPETAERLYEEFVAAARARGVTVATGRFRASMRVALVNDGPVTLWLDSRGAS